MKLRTNPNDFVELRQVLAAIKRRLEDTPEKSAIKGVEALGDEATLEDVKEKINEILRVLK